MLISRPEGLDAPVSRFDCGRRASRPEIIPRSFFESIRSQFRRPPFVTESPAEASANGLQGLLLEVAQSNSYMFRSCLAYAGEQSAVMKHPSLYSAALEEIEEPPIPDVRSSGLETPASRHRLHVTVDSHISGPGTVAALVTFSGCQLASNLCAHIRLLAAEAVPFHFSQRKTARSCIGSWSAACAPARVRCCELTSMRPSIRDRLVPRSQTGALADLLIPRSLVMIARQLHWWQPRGCSTVRWLRQRGHHVIIVNHARRRNAGTRIRILAVRQALYRSFIAN